MFKYIEVYKNYKKVATQHFEDGVTIIPRVGEYIQIKGLFTSYRIKSITYNYWDGVLCITVE